MLCDSWICISVYAVCHGGFVDIVLQFTQYESATPPDADCDGETYSWSVRIPELWLGAPIEVPQFHGGSGVNCIASGTPSPTPTVEFLFP